MLLAPMLLLLAQVRAPLSGMAVDGEGRPVVGVEIVLAWDQAIDGTVPILARATAAAGGRYAIAAPALKPRSSRYAAPYLAAYRAGSGLVVTATYLKPADPADYRLGFRPAGQRTIALRDEDGRPLAGVRLAPVDVNWRQPGGLAVMLPDLLMDRLEASTGPDGRAEFSCLEPTTGLVAVRVRIPGMATQVVQLPPKQFKSEQVALEVKRAGRMSGRVLQHDGKPAAGVDVEVWSRARQLVPLRPVHFEAGPVRGGIDGTFRTPAALLAGGTYRAVVRARGFKPVVTEWVTPEAGADRVTALADVVLTPAHDVDGRVIDRQGRPVAGAEVVAGGESPSATTDDAGRFRLVGLAPGRSLLVVRRDGFRIDGRVLAAPAAEVEVALTRFDEPAARTMTTLTTLPGRLPLEERRRLARRLIEPYLVKLLARGDDLDKSNALWTLMRFDPGAALEALERTTFQKAGYPSDVRRLLALAMVRDDPEEAAAVANSIPEARLRAQALVELCVRLPDDQRARKRALVDQVLLAARAEPDPKPRVWQLGEAAELLLDLGEADQARAVFAEGRAIAEHLDSGSWMFSYFASRLGRVDLPAALALLGGIEKAESLPLEFGNLAARIAASQPAEAERLAALIRPAPRSAFVTFRICQNMARADLPRARRIATGHSSPAVRAGALIFAAHGLPSSERPTARDLVREALGEMDRARGQFDLYRFSPASFMPLVEPIDPGLVPELFWRTVVNLDVHDDPRTENRRQDAQQKAVLLARYDLDVASALFEPAAAAPSGVELRLLALTDPNRAVAIVEAMPDPGNVALQGANSARLSLAAHLGEDLEDYWRGAWSSYSDLFLILDRRDVQ